MPGSPETVEQNAEALGKFGQSAGTVGDDLGKVDVASWSGEAYNKFFGRFAQEPPKWRDAGDALGTARSQLTGHAETLRWAQSQAREAIAMWERGEAATKQAKDEHDKAVTVANAAGGGSASPLQPFNDPGEKVRQEAQELLNRARTQLSEAGNGAAGALQGLMGKLTPKNSSGDAKGKGPNAGWTWVNPKLAVDDDGLGTNKYGTNNAEGEAKKAANRGDFVFGGGVKGHANLVDGTLTGKTEMAGVDLSGKATGNVGATGSAVAAVTQDGAKIGVAGNIGAGGIAEGKANWGIIGATGKGTAFVGAEGEANLTAGKEGIQGQAGAFAGAKAGGSLGGDVGGLGAGVAAEGWAGAGAEAEFDLGKGDDGKWHIGGHAGVGLGLGGKVGGEVTIDPPKIGDTIGKAGKAIGGLFD
ncbi:putative T7SS-secreted protein [Actinophytocola sp.]|uniref:putative T7SS-secreted protein n=1 Tax=Actinophytocola sp. TaxID=1872138 RepID=UPI003D6ADAAB